MASRHEEGTMSTTHRTSSHRASGLLRRIDERRTRARAVSSWRQALSRANTPAALAEIEFLHDRVR